MLVILQAHAVVARGVELDIAHMDLPYLLASRLGDIFIQRRSMASALSEVEDVVAIAVFLDVIAKTAIHDP